MRLYRAVSQTERDDIQSLLRHPILLTEPGLFVSLLNETGVLRCGHNGYIHGKWFALTEEAARTWAQQFAEFDGQQYYIVQVEAGESL